MRTSVFVFPFIHLSFQPDQRTIIPRRVILEFLSPAVISRYSILLWARILVFTRPKINHLCFKRCGGLTADE